VSAPGIVTRSPFVRSGLAGDVAELVRRGDAAVLIDRPVRSGAQFPGDVLVVSDGTSAARAVVAAAGALAAGHEARPLLLHVGRPTRATRRELAEQATMLYEATGAKPVALGFRASTPPAVVRLVNELLIAVVAVDTSALGLDLAGRLSCSVFVVP
jgi:hypothetical protein